MNVVLTDHLVCPRCGPPFGLVLLAHNVRDRRVREGEFGCPNCRDRFPVEDGFADLRPPPRGSAPGEAEGTNAGDATKGASTDATGRTGASDEEVESRALRLAAALGVAEGPGLIVVPDSHRAEAGPLARLVRGIEVVVVGWWGRAVVAEGVSAFVTGPKLPLRDGVARGVVVAGGEGEGWWGESLRVLVPGGRIVISRATPAARGWVGGAGLVTVLDEGGMVVAAVPAPGAGARPGRWMGTIRPPR